MKKKEARIIDWSKDLELAVMFTEWVKYTGIKKIRSLDYTIDFGAQDVIISQSLN